MQPTSNIQRGSALKFWRFDGGACRFLERDRGNNIWLSSSPSSNVRRRLPDGAASKSAVQILRLCAVDLQGGVRGDSQRLVDTSISKSDSEDDFPPRSADLPGHDFDRRNRRLPCLFGESFARATRWPFGPVLSITSVGTQVWSKFQKLTLYRQDDWRDGEMMFNNLLLRRNQLTLEAKIWRINDKALGHKEPQKLFYHFAKHDCRYFDRLFDILQ